MADNNIPQTKTKKRPMDPVSGKEVDTETEFTAGFGGETFYFENEKNKQEFQKKRDFYARKAHGGGQSEQHEGKHKSSEKMEKSQKSEKSSEKSKE